MKTRVAYGLIAVGLIAALSACGSFKREQRAAWRGEAERVCLSRGLIIPTSFSRPIKEIDGPGVCGLERPFSITAVQDGETAIDPSARLGCPMNAAVNDWMRDVVQPAAQARFGVRVASLNNMASYGCRTRNNRKGAKLSEHSFGNALDVGAFTLMDGRQVSVLRDWRGGAPDAQAFLRDVHAGACGLFKTVLGPGSDGFHENHFHFDLARHNAKGSAYCRPRPVRMEPAPLPGEAPFAPSREDVEDMPMSYAPAPAWPKFLKRDDVFATGALRGRPKLDLLDVAPEDYGDDE